MTHTLALKLAVAEDQQAALLRSALLARAGQREQTRLVSIYYDTRRLQLRKAGLILRLRKSGSAWMQTVRRTTTPLQALQRAPEWHAPYLNHFDFGSVEDAALREWLSRDKLRNHLASIFEADIRRAHWSVEPRSGVRIDVRFDRGWIAAGGRRESVSELELQLERGSADELFALALEFAQRFSLPPQILTKGERGYRLFLDRQPQPEKAAGVALDPSDTPLAAFRLIALDCLFHLQHNHAGAAHGDDPEYVHQMRVAARRLRAAMRLFRPVLPGEFGECLAGPLRQLMQTLGQTRDLDVLMSEIVAPVAAALPDEPRLTELAGVIVNRRYQARDKTRATLRQPAYGQLLLSAGRLLHGAPFIAAPGQTDGSMTLLQFADRGLRKLLRRVQELGRAADIAYPPSLHELRIGIKRLRYAIEFFGPLIPEGAGPRLVRKLATLQEELGQLNDLASAGIVLTGCAGNDANLREAVSLVGGWHGQRHADLLADIPTHLDRIRRLKLPRLAG